MKNESDGNLSNFTFFRNFGKIPVTLRLKLFKEGYFKNVMTGKEQEFTVFVIQR